MGIRLPGRAGSSAPFHFGATLTGAQANFNGRIKSDYAEQSTFLNRTAPTGKYPANKWGLFDMHGNVAQWCEDYYGAYDSLPRRDPVQSTRDPGNHHVCRGGSYMHAADDCRAGRRIRRDPAMPGGNRIGMRVVMLAERMKPSN